MGQNEPSKRLMSKKVGDLAFKYECEDDRVFSELRDEIERLSFESDCAVICNGNNGRAKNSRKFLCQALCRDRKTPSDSSEEESDKKKGCCDYRGTYMTNNDKRGRREDGKAGPRRTAVSDTSHKCPFKFVLKWDEYGYFIELRKQAGHKTHKYHPKPVPKSTPLPARLLTDGEIETVQHITESTFNNGCARNYLYSTLGVHLSRAKVAYITSQKDGERDELERMFTMMKESEEVSYSILWDPAESEAKSKNPSSLVYPADKASSRPSLVSTTKEDGVVRHEDIADDPDMRYIADEVSAARADPSVADEESVFVAIAWTVAGARRYFKLCPEVVFCDITSHTNKNGYHLLTFSNKTSLDKQNVFLWVWLPNQRRYSFRWVFRRAVSTLLPWMHLEMVRMIQKDGDPQQGNEVLAAMPTVFPRAIVGGCGWHIVDRSWQRYIGAARNVIRKVNWAKWDSVQKMIHRFIYSLMKRGSVEDEEEYEVAKQVLFDFIKGPLVRQVCDGNQVFIQRIIEWLENNVLPHENLFLHFRRKGHRHFGVAHSSPHEGTNFGMKSHSAGVKPTMSMDKSASAMCLQSSMKSDELDEIAYNDYMKRDKKWSSLPTSQFLGRHAEGLTHRDGIPPSEALCCPSYRSSDLRGRVYRN